MPEPPPFNLDALDPLAIPQIKPAIGVGGALVWRYTLLLPVGEGNIGEIPTPIVGALELLRDLRHKLANHFHGVTVLPPLQGFGLRDARDTMSVESNINVPILVYAAPLTASDRYFEVLQEGVRTTLKQGLVLLERQDVLLLGSYSPRELSYLTWSPWFLPVSRELPSAP